MFMFSGKPSDFLQKVNKTILNISAKCRGCLTEEPCMHSLFVKFEKNTTLAKLIEESICYQITEEEQFSEFLCKDCTRIIVDFIRFKTTFREATEYFKNLNNLQNINQNTKGFNVEEENNYCKDDLTVSESKIEWRNESESQKSKPNLECVTENSDNFDNLAETSCEDKIIHSRKKLRRIKQINCEFCDKYFRSKVQLQRHKKAKHKETPKKHFKKQPKDSLGESFKESNQPNVPVKNSNPSCSEVLSDDPKSKCLCKVCKQEVPSEEFEYHLDTHKTHVCNICGHRFIRKTDLNDHQETHLDVCKYVCQHCGKAFKVRTALNKHKRIHTNPREEICDVCGQRFNTRDTLKTHYKLKHIKSKDFQCNLCGLAFTLKSTLEKHIERHNPNRQRIYSCNLCNVSYINKYNLSRHHVIKHTAFENKPICEFCGKGYVKKIDLVKHMKRHHGQNDIRKKNTEESGEIKLEND